MITLLIKIFIAHVQTSSFSLLPQAFIFIISKKKILRFKSQNYLPFQYVIIRSTTMNSLARDYRDKNYYIELEVLLL